MGGRRIESGGKHSDRQEGTIIITQAKDTIGRPGSKGFELCVVNMCSAWCVYTTHGQRRRREESPVLISGNQISVELAKLSRKKSEISFRITVYSRIPPSGISPSLSFPCGKSLPSFLPRRPSVFLQCAPSCALTHTGQLSLYSLHARVCVLSGQYSLIGCLLYSPGCC